MESSAMTLRMAEDALQRALQAHLATLNYSTSSQAQAQAQAAAATTAAVLPRDPTLDMDMCMEHESYGYEESRSSNNSNFTSSSSRHSPSRSRRSIKSKGTLMHTCTPPNSHNAFSPESSSSVSSSRRSSASSSSAYASSSSSSSSSRSSSSSSCSGQLTPQRIQLVRKLRACIGGHVHLARFHPSMAKCVVKQVNGISTRHSTAEVIKNELNIHYHHISQLPDLSPRVVRMYNYTYDEKSDSVSLIIECGENGDLMAHVQQAVNSEAANDALRESVAQKYFVQLLEGVKYLHDNRVAHRDIKLENLVLDRHNDLKVIDFGLSIIADAGVADSPRCRHRVGTPAWMPPEVFDVEQCSKGYDPYRSDVWSCGVVLFTLLFGFPPFDVASPDDMAYKYIAAGRMRRLLGKWKVLDSASSAALDVLEAIFVHADHRPSVDDLMAMPFVVEGLNIQAAAAAQH